MRVNMPSKRLPESHYGWSCLRKDKNCTRSGKDDLKLTLQGKYFQTGTILKELSIIKNYARITEKNIRVSWAS